MLARGYGRKGSRSRVSNAVQGSENGINVNRYRERHREKDRKRKKPTEKDKESKGDGGRGRRRQNKGREREGKMESKSYTILHNTIERGRVCAEIVTSRHYMHLACEGYRESTRNIAITSPVRFTVRPANLAGYARLVARPSTSLNLRGR